MPGLARAARFGRARRGSVAALTAGALAMIVGAAALGVDVGSIYYARQKAQAAVDLAAIAGASGLPNYDSIARASLADNGFALSAVPGASVTIADMRIEALTLAPGRYAPVAATPVALRFQLSDAAGANALRVTMRHEAPIYFGKLLTGRSSYGFEVRATAATATSASFSIGSRLLRLDGGIANAILSALLGTNVTLSVMDYNALADARIDLLTFLDLYGEQIGVTAGSYDTLLAANGTVGKALAAASRAASTAGSSSAASALARLANATDVARLTIRLRDVIDLGPQGTTAIGEGPATLAQFDALNLLMAAAQVANKNRQIALDLALSLPGLASARLTLGVGERPARGVWLANGRAGAQAHTAQTRLLFNLRLLGNATIPAGIRLPLYVEIAAGDARLTTVRCRLNPAETRVEIEAKPGIVDAWIAEVGATEFSNMTTQVNPPPAQLVSLLGLAVTGRAHATMSNVAYDRLAYTRDDIRNGRAQTVRTRDYTTSLLTRLVGDLNLQTNAVGIPLIGSSLLKSAVTTLTQAATPSIDTLLFSTLTLLGVSLGEADVWANGVRCDGGVLVN